MRDIYDGLNTVLEIPVIMLLVSVFMAAALPYLITRAIKSAQRISDHARYIMISYAIHSLRKYGSLSIINPLRDLRYLSFLMVGMIFLLITMTLSNSIQTSTMLLMDVIRNAPEISPTVDITTERTIYLYVLYILTVRFGWIYNRIMIAENLERSLDALDCQIEQVRDATKKAKLQALATPVLARYR